MTHFDEATCLLYLDGQLGAQRAAELSAHTSTCGDCRALLSALEKESLSLAQALVEQDEPLPARLQLKAPPLPAAASWAHWAWALSFGLAAAAGFVLWIDVLQPWAEQLDQVGFQSSSLLSTAFFSGAFWEGWASMLDMLQYAALISLGMLVLAVWRPWRRQATVAAIALFGIVLLLALPSGTNAAEIRRGPNVIVTAGETVDNDLIVAGSAARIDGTVKGDVIAFVQDLTVSGHVTGDVIVFGQRARIDGQVDGNVRAFCNTLSLDSGPEKNVTVLASRLDLDPRATVGGSLTALVGTAVLRGNVSRDLLFLSNNTTIDGVVGGGVEFRGPRLEIGPTAQIAGRVHVIGQRNADVAQGARLARPLEFEFRQRRPGRFGGATFVFRQILAYGGAFLCGLLLIKLFPGLFAAGRLAARRVGLAMSIGALVLVAGIALFIFAIVLMIVGTGAGIATLTLYLPILYGAQVFVGNSVGEMILHKTATLAPSVGALALGLLVVRLLTNIPFLGFFVLAAVLVWGTGAICMALWARTRSDVSPVV
jgi:cytoskeletal protein CcmA (bactofilin family)